jgi:hypothetical protein
MHEHDQLLGRRRINPGLLEREEVGRLHSLSARTYADGAEAGTARKVASSLDRTVWLSTSTLKRQRIVYNRGRITGSAWA